MAYKWCVVPLCRNTSIYSPHKVFLSVPTNPKRRKMWLQLARRDPKSIAINSNVFMCEDHFEMEKDIKNYLKYKMGFSSKILLADEAVPTKFYCQEDHKVQKEDNRTEEENREEITQKNIEAPGEYPDHLDLDLPENLSFSEQVKMEENKYLYQCIRKRKRRNIEQLKKARATRIKKRGDRKDIEISTSDESVEMAEQEAPGRNKDQNMYSPYEYKDKWKRLRRPHTGEADSAEENNTVDEAPLNIEVDEIIKKENINSDTESAPDEPNTDNLLVEAKIQKKTVKRTKPVKLKRNPKRRAVIEKEIEKSARVANYKKTASKKAKETKETDIEFNLMEQLYEYGKYVAEQLMCFDETVIQSAKMEINEVLTKYRLKYKIMISLKPKNGETGPNTNNVGKKVPTEPGISREQPEPNTPKPVKIIVTEPSIPQTELPQIVSVPSLNELGMMNTSSSTGATPIGLVIVPTTTAPGSHKKTHQVNSTRSVVSPGSLQIASAISTNLTGTAAIPAWTSVTQSRSSVGISMYQPGSSSASTSQTVNPLGLDISLTEQQFESAESGSGLARLEVVGSQVGSSQIPGGISSSPNSLETSEPPFQMPQIHYIIPTSLKMEPEELELKYEPQSEEEEGVP